MNRPFDAAVYAFYPNKQVGMGEGGCIVTNNKDIDTFCRAFRNQGRSPGDTWLESSIIGYNFRLTDIQAAIGIVQLMHIDEIIQKRHNVYLQYLHNLILDERIKLQEFSGNWTQLSHFVFTVEVDNRSKVMQYLADKGIDTRAYFPCIHLQKPYRGMGYHEGMYPIAEEVASRTLALPFYSDMPESEVDYVCKCFKEAINMAQ
jgi:perosamine synthetase